MKFKSTKKPEPKMNPRQNRERPPKVICFTLASFLTLAISNHSAFAQNPPALGGQVDPELGFRSNVNADESDTAENDPSLLEEESKHYPRHESKQATEALKRVLGKLVISPVAQPIQSWRNANQTNYRKILAHHPELFKLFEIHQNRYSPSLENGSTVVNSEDFLDGINDHKFGICEGASTLNRYFTILAFFDPDSKAGLKLGQDAPPDRASHPAEWLKYYQKKIRHVATGHATLIPGFKNFRELSLDPQLEVYLKKWAVRLWANRVSTIGQLKIGISSTEPMNATQRASLVLDLRERLKRNELPKIVITAQKTNRWLGIALSSHSLLVYDVRDLKDGSTRIMVWDPDFFTETLASNPKYVEIRPHGQMLYEPWYEANDPVMSDRLGPVKIAPDNDTDTAKMLLSLKHFCSGPGSYYCKTHR